MIFLTLTRAQAQRNSFGFMAVTQQQKTQLF